MTTTNAALAVEMVAQAEQSNTPATERAHLLLVAADAFEEAGYVTRAKSLRAAAKVVRIQNIPQKGYTRFGKRYDRAPLMGHHADVTPSVSVRLHGIETNRHGGPAAYDLTFKLGDSAIYGSYNLVYTGEITQISAKCVTITETRYVRDPAEQLGARMLERGKAHRLDLADFSSRNCHYDAEKIAERNSAWMD